MEIKMKKVKSLIITWVPQVGKKVKFAVVLFTLICLMFSFFTIKPVSAAACAQYYMVQLGDDLYRIASMFGVDWISLASINGIASPYSLQPGQTLCIPVFANTSVTSYTYPYTYSLPASYYYNNTYIPNVNVVSPIVSYIPNTYTSVLPYGCTRYHTVQWGENLYRIGLLYGVSWTTLASLNGITNPYAVYAGQNICVATAYIPPIYPRYCRVNHIVQLGQTLNQIGRIYGVNWMTLAWLNNLPNPHRIYVGQTLCIFP